MAQDGSKLKTRPLFFYIIRNKLSSCTVRLYLQCLEGVSKSKTGQILAIVHFKAVCVFCWLVGGAGQLSLQPHRQLVQRQHLLPHDSRQLSEGEQVPVRDVTGRSTVPPNLFPPSSPSHLLLGHQGYKMDDLITSYVNMYFRERRGSLNGYQRFEM